MRKREDEFTPTERYAMHLVLDAMLLKVEDEEGQLSEETIEVRVSMRWGSAVRYVNTRQLQSARDKMARNVHFE